MSLHDYESDFFDSDGFEQRFARLKKMEASFVPPLRKLEFFREALNDEEASIRYAAVVGIRELKRGDDRKLTDLVVDALLYALSDSSQWVKIRAVEGLGQVGAKRAVDVMIRYLESSNDDPKLRATIVKHLGSFREERLIPIIAHYLNDQDARVRANAIEGLGFFPKENVLHILEPYLGDENVRIRANVAVILSRYEMSNAAGVLSKMVDSQDSFERTGAIYSMGELRDEKYIPSLLKRLNDPSFLVQKNVQDALAKFGNKIQGLLLKEIRQSRDSTFIFGAINVLRRIGDRKAMKTLLRLRESGDGELRSLAEAAVDEIISRT
jgi:HEAT repeat protein